MSAMCVLWYLSAEIDACPNTGTRVSTWLVSRWNGGVRHDAMVLVPLALVDVHTDAHKSLLEPANPSWTRSVHLDSLSQRHRQQPVSWTADPE